MDTKRRGSRKVKVGEMGPAGAGRHAKTSVYLRRTMSQADCKQFEQELGRGEKGAANFLCDLCVLCG